MVFATWPQEAYTRTCWSIKPAEGSNNVWIARRSRKPQRLLPSYLMARFLQKFWNQCVQRQFSKPKFPK